jgi:hypothetical protein
MIDLILLGISWLFVAPAAPAAPTPAPAPGVDVTFVDGAVARTRRYRLPIPLENRGTRLRVIEPLVPGATQRADRLEVSLVAKLVKDRAGSSWLEYDIARRALDVAGGKSSPPPGLPDVEVEGTVPLPAGRAMTVGEVAGPAAAGGVAVRLEVVQPTP